MPWSRCRNERNVVQVLAADGQKKTHASFHDIWNEICMCETLYLHNNISGLHNLVAVAMQS